MESIYAICGLYYMAKKYKGKEVCYGVQSFLGLEGEKKIYVYDEGLTDRSLTFNSLEEAENYIEEHGFNEMKPYAERHFVLEVSVW